MNQKIDIKKEYATLISFLILNEPFYGLILSKFDIECGNENKDIYIKKNTIYLNSVYIDEVCNDSIKKFNYIILSIIFKIVFKHACADKKTLDTELWELASNYSIDYILVNDKFLQQLCISPFNFSNNNFFNLTALDIYKKLLLYPKKELEDLTNSFQKIIIYSSKLNHIDIITSEFINEYNVLSDKKFSNINKNLLENIDIPIQQNQFNDFLMNLKLRTKKYRKKSMNYKRLNKRFIHTNLIVPNSSIKKNIFNLKFYIDTSASIKNEYLQKIFNNIFYLLSNQVKFSIKLILGDTSITDTIILEKRGDLELLKNIIVNGRGGTNFGEFIEDIENDNIKYDEIFMVSDFFIDEKEKKAIEMLPITLLSFSENIDYINKKFYL
jgi:hypothetical protein